MPNASLPALNIKNEAQELDDGAISDDDEASTPVKHGDSFNGLKSKRSYNPNSPTAQAALQNVQSARSSEASNHDGTSLPSPQDDGGPPLQPHQPNTARPPRGRPSRAPSRTQRQGTKPDGRARTPKSSRRPKTPMTPAVALQEYQNELTAFEQSEILEYQQIYFVGSTPNKIKGIPHTINNNGYDDERGDYKLVIGDHLEYRYQILSMLGRGSFGQVVKVMDKKKDCIVALKVIRNKKRFHHQALVEVKILEHLMVKDKEHKSNIVRVYGYFYFRNHLCITFEALSMNLYEFIKVNHFKGFSLGLIRRFAVQLLQGLVLLQKEKIIHCDLKPENVLLKSPNKSNIKLIDFGSSCFENERIYTYIQSRFYRSPEVILGLPYDISIDMWSFGCILVELYTGYPLFPGENEAEQIQCIMEILGPPPRRVIQVCTRKKAFFDDKGKPLITPNSRGKIRKPGSKDLVAATRCTDPHFISFLKKCLRWDPKVRMTPDKALEHPWITEIRARASPSPDNEPEEEEEPAAGKGNPGATSLLPPIAQQTPSNANVKVPNKKENLSASQRW